MKTTRRNFNQLLLKSTGSLALAGALPVACSAENKRTNESPYKGKKLGVALVGLGGYSKYQLAPALQDTKYCKLTGVVTSRLSKAQDWAKEYSLPENNLYTYDTFDEVVNNPNIDIIYIVLPNSMHADFSIRAAQAGKHVICEKPMAMNVAECDQIIEACEKADVKLSVGYRLHSEPYTQELKKVVREKYYGDVRHVSSEAGYYSATDPGQWRLDKKLSGGGALMNMGVYAIQSAIYGSGMNPISVTAQEFSTRPEYFKDTDETITAQFNFPNGATGQMITSHNFNTNRHLSNFEKGWVELQPANNYGPLSGRTSDGKTWNFPHESQQKLQMDDFARHILEGTTNVAPGEMGRRDMVIVEAIYKSIAEGGKKISLKYS